MHDSEDVLSVLSVLSSLDFVSFKKYMIMAHFNYFQLPNLIATVQ